MTGGTIVADPMYRAIAEELRHDIESGELPPGSQLPAEFKLQDRFSASRNTVRDAIKSLVSLGLVVTRPGQGTFVAERIDHFVTTLSADAETGFGGGEGATYLSEVSRAHREPAISQVRVELQLAQLTQCRGRLGIELQDLFQSAARLLEPIVIRRYHGGVQ